MCMEKSMYINDYTVIPSQDRQSIDCANITAWKKENSSAEIFDVLGARASEDISKALF